MPSVTVDVMNVWDERLPEFDNAAIDAKYKGVAGSAMNEAETGVWNRIKALVARFKQADRIVLGVPMWNFAYPYKLKQLIDLVSQRNMLFTFDGERFGPLLKTPRAMVIYTRGQEYREDLPTPPSWKTKPSWAIVAGADRIINPDLERWYYARAHSHTIELEGASHSVYESRPKEVAALIEEAAQKSQN